MVSPCWYRVIDFETAEIPLGGKRGEGKVALVDIAMLPLIARHSRKWCLHNTGYAGAHSRLVRRNVLLHRVVMDVVSGGRDVDHISRNKLDNRRSNLRLVSRSENNRNKMTRGSSKFPGVAYDKAIGKWRSQIRDDDGHIKFLGFFISELDAARAYRAAALELDPLLSFPVWSEL